MIESPVMKEFAEKIGQEIRVAVIVEALKARFGKAANQVEAQVRPFVNEEQLVRLHRFAVVCPSVEAFQDRLQSEPPRPADAAKGKRRKPKS